MRLAKEVIFHNGLLNVEFFVLKRFQQENFCTILTLPDLVLLVSKTNHGVLLTCQQMESYNSLKF